MACEGDPGYRRRRYVPVTVLPNSHLINLAPAAFNFDFGALDSKENELSKAYENMSCVPPCLLSMPPVSTSP